MSGIFNNGGYIGHSHQFIERIQFVGGASFAGTTTVSIASVSLTALVGGIGTAPIEGDLVFVSLGVASTVDRTLECSGNISGAYTTAYTEIYIVAATTFDTNLESFYRIMGDSPDTTLTFTATTAAATDGWAATVMVWRFVDPVTPLDVASTTASASGSALADAPSITPVTPGCVVLVVGAAASNGGLQYFYYTDDTLQCFYTNAGNSTNDVTVGSVAYFNWTSGAYNPGAFKYSTTNPTNGSWAAATVVLRPDHLPTGSTGMWSSNAVFNARVRIT